MAIFVRKIGDRDARSFLQVHHAAVRGIAARDYPQAIIEDWAPLPITERSIAAFLANPDNEVRLVAEIDGEVVGIGACVLEKNELRACYVAPNASRKGVGSAIVRAIEKIALNNGLASLQMDSSLTAAPFYCALGYAVTERGEHVRHSGQRMACVKMEKSLVSR
jgi:putative acetyltransferase